MDELRYASGVIMIMTVPINLGVWLLIRPLAGAWRRIGPLGTYAALTLPSAALGVWLWARCSAPTSGHIPWDWEWRRSPRRSPQRACASGSSRREYDEYCQRVARYLPKRSQRSKS